jgi:hypothetical protein
MSSAAKDRRSSDVKDARKRNVIGPAVFLVTLLASLVFFWWLLIYDHGVPVAH